MGEGAGTAGHQSAYRPGGSEFRLCRQWFDRGAMDELLEAGAAAVLMALMDRFQMREKIYRILMRY